MKRVVFYFSVIGLVNILGNFFILDVVLSNEVLIGVYIRKVWWGIDVVGVLWIVKRGGNIVLIFNILG